MLLVAGTTDVAYHCPDETGAEPVGPGLDGVVIDPGKYGPITPQTAFAACRGVGGLTVCPSATDRYDILVVAVHPPRDMPPVAVEIGLAGTGGIARTILQSVRPAPAAS